MTNVDNNYNERPSLNQLTYLSQVLKSKDIDISDKLWKDEGAGLTMKQYKYILALAFEGKVGKLNNLLKELKLI